MKPPAPHAVVAAYVAAASATLVLAQVILAFLYEMQGRSGELGSGFYGLGAAALAVLAGAAFAVNRDAPSRTALRTALPKFALGFAQGIAAAVLVVVLVAVAAFLAWAS